MDGSSQPPDVLNQVLGGVAVLALVVGVAGVLYRRSLIRARALLHLGWMALDGDGTEQSDEAALERFAAARRAVLDAVPSTRDAAVGECEAQLGCEEAARCLVDALLQIDRDAKDVIASMGRFEYFANGRP